MEYVSTLGDGSSDISVLYPLTHSYLSTRVLINRKRLNLVALKLFDRFVNYNTYIDRYF